MEPSKRKCDEFLILKYNSNDENYNNIKESKSRTMMLPFQTLLVDAHQIVKK